MSVGPLDAGSSRGRRAPAIAAAMATMEGCRAVGRGVTTSLGLAVATVAATGRYGRRGSTPWVGSALRQRGHCVCCSNTGRGRQCVVQRPKMATDA